MSNTLFSCFPNADDLIALGPEDLGPVLLRLAVPRVQSGGVLLEAVMETPIVDVHAGRDWPFHKKQAVMQAATRAWLWLEREGFIEPTSGQNGRNGWRNITDKGRQVAGGRDIQRFLAARDFPKAFLHPLIRDSCVAAIMRSANGGAADELRAAVVSAFTTVEDAVRNAGGFVLSDFGAVLMNKAFHVETGPLRDMETEKPRGERQALADFFAASYMRFRNGPSHGLRPITLTEAQDCFLLASHLLRLVDAQRPPSDDISSRES
jgi:uncharacterized protein (TIGR02391 family)